MPLGPIVGHVTARDARVWFRSEGVRARKARLKRDKSVEVRDVTPDAHGIVIARFSGLTPDTRYTCEFLNEDGDRIADLASFTTMPSAPTRFSFAFASCNLEAAGSMWSTLRTSITDDEPRLLLLCGDQIYTDDHPPNIWNVDYPDDAAAHDAWAARYVKQWSPGDIASVLRSLPTYMIWDDHEICDDWGSNPRYRDHMRAPGVNQTKRKYEAARTMCERYQASHGVPRSHASFDYGFLVGSIAFYVLDLRTARGTDPSYPVLGREQFDRFKAWLHSDAATAELLFVVSPVPLAHIGDRTLNWAQLRGEDMELEFDASDQWNHRTNKADLERLLDTLFDWQTEGNAYRATYVIGGDVHVATATMLKSYRSKHHRRWQIFQFTSSAIANIVGNRYRGLARAVYEEAVRDDIPLPEGYYSTNEELVMKRNFGRINATKNDDGTWAVEFHLHVDGATEPKLMRKVPS